MDREYKKMREWLPMSLSSALDDYRGVHENVPSFF